MDLEKRPKLDMSKLFQLSFEALAILLKQDIPFPYQTKMKEENCEVSLKVVDV